MNNYSLYLLMLFGGVMVAVQPSNNFINCLIDQNQSHL